MNRKSKAAKLNELIFKSLEQSRRYEKWENALIIENVLLTDEMENYHIISPSTGRMYDVCEHSKRVVGSETRIMYTLSEVDGTGHAIKQILVGHNNGAVTSTETGCEIIATYGAVKKYMYMEDTHELLA